MDVLKDALAVFVRRKAASPLRVSAAAAQRSDARAAHDEVVFCLLGWRALSVVAQHQFALCVFDDNGVRWVSDRRGSGLHVWRSVQRAAMMSNGYVQMLPFSTDAELVIQTIHELQPSARPQGAEPAPFRTNDLLDCVQSHIAVPYEEDVTVRCVFVFGRSHEIPIVDGTHPLLHKPVRLIPPGMSCLPQDLFALMYQNSDGICPPVFPPRRVVRPPEAYRPGRALPSECSLRDCHLLSSSSSSSPVHRAHLPQPMPRCAGNLGCARHAGA